MSKIISVKGIVLRTTNYSETSIICDIYTDLLGTKGYIISGVRTDKPNKTKGVFFQPTALLDLVVYNHESKNLNRIKEFKWYILYKQIYFSVFRNAIALFVVELLSRTLRHPDYNPELFHFTEKTLLAIDTVDKNIYANIPLYFMVHLIHYLGFRISTDDLQLSKIISTENIHYMDAFLHTKNVEDLAALKLNRQKRNDLFVILQEYYQTHINDFGTMKSYRVMRDILSENS